ncbi:HdeD family acid-resistance protein [Bifidobacterium callimiconis]|uniref:HdeD family acid-resistance protein n=1 Tax=Bifidobacterium callimiconis TaxID=2306973 RepID=A0A430F6V6_9BIFI|nr:DUF308 domain-containing protein [Bifidobacterium callimiconis]MBT1177785.1 DUF308 domain-containing protein [Bifidobacterium callimiconis]RSX48025.1 hypothetical protein D2E23_2211 [Bifidobacterium callimiconis]
MTNSYGYPNNPNEPNLNGNSNVPSGNGAGANPDPRGEGPFSPDDIYQPVDPFRLIVEDLPRRATNIIRSIYGVVGAAAVLAGLALLIVPGKTMRVVAVVLGIYFIVSGAMRAIGALVEPFLPGGWRVLDLLLGTLLVIGGVVIMKDTAFSSEALALVVTITVGIGWIIEGILTLAESWALPRSGWAIAAAILSILAGVIVLVSPVQSTVWLVMFAACALIVLGVVSCVRSFTFGRSK